MISLALRSDISFRFFDISVGSFCQKGQVPALSAKKQNICLNKYSPVSFSIPLETQIIQDVQQTFILRLILLHELFAMSFRKLQKSV